MKRVVLPILLILLLLGAWEIYVDLGGVAPDILPAPHAVASALWNDRGLLWSNFLVTAREVLLGLIVTAVFGLALAVALHFSPTLRHAFYPLLVASQAIPFPVLAPILLVWLGFGILPKIIVVVLVSFFSIVVATLAGFAAVDPQLLKLMRTFDASRMRTFRHVEFPAALPGLFTGAKIAVAVSVIGAVFAEYNGSNAGLGYLINISIPQLLSARAVAATVVLALFAIALFALLSVAERRVLPWAYEPRGELAR